jgi:hypothetical protein
VVNINNKEVYINNYLEKINNNITNVTPINESQSDNFKFYMNNSDILIILTLKNSLNKKVLIT